MTRSNLGTVRILRVITIACIVVVACTAAMHTKALLTADYREDESLRRQATQEYVPGSSAIRAHYNQPHLSVLNTNIDYPLAQATLELGNDYYLTHDIAGNSNHIGCPFIDYRTSINARHVLVYAHSNSLTNVLFSEIKSAYRQDIFETIGDACITNTDASSHVFHPTMALSINEDYQTIQSFSFSQEELGAWLVTLKQDASALSKDIDTQISNTRQVLTLVTCSSNISGQPKRTLLIFCSSTRGK